MKNENFIVDKGFYHVLGPSPALRPAHDDGKSWDSLLLESCDIMKDGFTYYWFFHGHNEDRFGKGYQIGVATASSPLGPWTKFEGNPIVGYGEDGTWDSESVDCACVLKAAHYDDMEGTGRGQYYMFYCGVGKDEDEHDRGLRHVGVAMAEHPLGPWTKYEGNPIIRDFGYLGGVEKIDGKLYMFNQFPIGLTDQGNYTTAEAFDPYGPWKKSDEPVIRAGDWGAWDDGGFSEARFRYSDGVYHCFYGGTKTPKIESIGYAYSFDGKNYHKYSGNPVVSVSKVPEAQGFAEVATYIESPYVYIYHTYRTLADCDNDDDRWLGEDLGIQVLSTDPHFKLTMPALILDSLSADTAVEERTSIPLGFEHASTLALTVKATFDAKSDKDLILHLRSSYDGTIYDTEDLDTAVLTGNGTGEVVKTFNFKPKVLFLRVVAENAGSGEIRGLDIRATVGN